MIKRLRRMLVQHSLPLRVSAISRRVKAQHLTYLPLYCLYTIEQCIRQVNTHHVPGVFVEAGVALGGSSIVLASLMTDTRSFHGFDVFGMIPPPTSDKDDSKSKERYAEIAKGTSEGLNGNTYYGYIKDLYQVVVKNFEAFHLHVDHQKITLHQGLFEDSLKFPQNTQVALAHIDCDWYDPVRVCLERIYPQLSVGGYIILDDYNYYGGCRRATDEFLAEHADLQIVSLNANLVLKRV